MFRRLLAEGLGSLLLAATVVGSGIMAERLALGNAAIALLANTGATVAALAVLIRLLGPVSGAHFNPAVSLVLALRRALTWQEAGAYVVCQVLGCCLGAFLAHAMFELALVQASLHIRTGSAQWLAEAVATFGLLLVVLGHRRSEDAPWNYDQAEQGHRFRGPRFERRPEVQNLETSFLGRSPSANVTSATSARVSPEQSKSPQI